MDGLRGNSERLERRDAAAHRRRILDVARALFTARGVAAVTMQEIALAAGVGKGTLYRRYAHKGQLCLALLGDSIARFRAEVGEVVADTPASDADRMSSLDRLDAVLAGLVRFNEANGPLLAAVEEAGGERHGAMYDSSFYRWLHATVSQLLEHAVKGEECAPLDIPYTADAILAALAIDLYRYQRRAREFTPERIAEAARRLYRDGLRR